MLVLIVVVAVVLAGAVICRPAIVQAVRSVDDRAIASDLTWTLESEQRDKEADYYSRPGGAIPRWIYNQ